jgi:hypothetical protein
VAKPAKDGGKKKRKVNIQEQTEETNHQESHEPSSDENELEELSNNDQEGSANDATGLWCAEILTPKERLALEKKSDTFDIKDPFWQYVLVVKALAKVKLKETEPEDLIAF